MRAFRLGHIAVCVLLLSFAASQRCWNAGPKGLDIFKRRVNYWIENMDNLLLECTGESTATNDTVEFCELFNRMQQRRQTRQTFAAKPLLRNNRPQTLVFNQKKSVFSWVFNWFH
ncbi:hypothetical protein KR093_000100 [Drosophila rubida]|uniref:Uncharacterized protein n=1 Tax=Drosophila rubida TaxID=30044 RepID=A0AAD4K5L8_9MUSC|nr:hypothetical protein KR093_000100 [Drosophila rubida]